MEKVDLWRLLKIYLEGGIYLDFDRYCNKSFDDIIDSETKCVLPTCRDHDFSQDIMISCKHNPLFRVAIDNNIIARGRGASIVAIGPGSYMHSVTEVVFGNRTGSSPGHRKMKAFRTALDNSRYFQTFREVPMNNTFIFLYDKKTFQVGDGRYKMHFYKDQNVQHHNQSSGTLLQTLWPITILIALGLVVLLAVCVRRPSSPALT